MPAWRVDLLPDGRVAMLHHDDVAALSQSLGTMTAHRLTDVLFDAAHQVWTPLAHVDIPEALKKAMFQGFARRADAIAHEVKTFSQMHDSYGALL